MPVVPPDPVVSDETLPREVDVVVIGGGIAGTTTTLFLAERGVSVALCEKGRVAGEQSGRNWGWVRQMGRDAAELPLAIESLRIWGGLQERIGADAGFRRTGITYLTNSERQLAEHEAWLEHARLYQLPSRLLSKKELPEHLTGLSGEAPRGGLYTANDGRAEPTMAAPAIANAARRAGAHVMTGCAVRGLETEGGAVASVVTEKGRIKCRSVVLAAGAWSRLFLGNLGIDFPQLKILGAAARVEGVDGEVPEMPVGADDYSFRKRVDGGYTVARRNVNIAPITPDSFRLFFDYLPILTKQWHEFQLGFGRQFWDEWKRPRRWALDQPSPFEAERVLDPAPREKLNIEGLRNLAKVFPAFAGARITHHWGGLIDVTPDSVPVIGPIDAIPGLFLASGFSGHGFGIGPGAGMLMADIVMGNTPFIDAAPFRFGRLRKETKAPAAAH